MAIDAATIWERNVNSTANNVNGGGFNTANANFITDYTVDTNTGNTSSPVVSSATYTFVAGDVGAMFYVKAGTNCYLDAWYPIASVAGGKATLSAAIGQGVIRTSGIKIENAFGLTTSTGISSVGTPTNITAGIDFSQQTSNEVTATDYAAVGASTTLTSVSAGFRQSMVGNIFHQTTTGTGAFGVVGWYEIVSYTNTTTVVLDRTPNTGTASVACTGFVGGALSMGALDDASFEAAVAGNIHFIKNGTYSISATINIAAAGTAVLPIYILGYATARGDNPSVFGASSTAPLFSFGNTSFSAGTRYIIVNFRVTSASTGTAFSGGATGVLMNIKVTNTSTTGAIAINPSSSVFMNSEAISYKGFAVSSATGNTYVGNYIHDSNTGIIRSNNDTSRFEMINNIIANNSAYGMQYTATSTGTNNIIGNTFYGSLNTTGIGIDFGTSTVRSIRNNIITGFSTGVIAATLQGGDYDDYNAYYNNDANTSNWTQGYHNMSVDPQFTNVTQLTNIGTVTSSTNVLTDSGANFANVVDGIDHVNITAITGTGGATGIFGITSHTTTTLTLAGGNLTSSGSGSAITYQITLGNNYAVGTNLKAKGIPGVFPGELSTGAMDIGAVQRVEASGSTGFFIQ